MFCSAPSQQFLYCKKIRLCLLQLFWVTAFLVWGDSSKASIYFVTQQVPELDL